MLCEKPKLKFHFSLASKTWLNIWGQACGAVCGFHKEPTLDSQLGQRSTLTDHREQPWVAIISFTQRMFTPSLGTLSFEGMKLILYFSACTEAKEN